MSDVEARLIAFDRHKDDLIHHLQKACGRRSFDPDTSWRHLRLFAWRYLLEEADAETRKRVPKRIKQLRDLGNLLSEARAALDKMRGPMFVKWCEIHGGMDVFHPINERRFDELTAGIADLGTAASGAAEDMRRKQGKPPGSGVLPPDFVIGLEQAYRNITGKPGTVSRGQFAQFIVKFMAALGREIEIEAVVQAVRAAKTSERWGRSPLAGKV
jgi:hypothetical protein